MEVASPPREFEVPTVPESFAPYELPAEPARPVAWRGFALWTGVVYFLLYALPFPFSSLPMWAPWKERLGSPALPSTVEKALGAWDGAIAWIAGGIGELWQSTVLWLGKDVLGIEIVVQPTGSGDTAFAYVQMLVCAALALALGAIGFAALRRGPPRWVLALVALGLCYWVACNLAPYGIFKLIKSQFPSPHLSRLIQPYGDSSPMGIVWTFMGLSAPYNWFSGFVELLGPVLLLFRRTRLLGALVAIAALANVVAINFFYDVPVKLYSAHMLVFAAAIAAYDGRRLVRFFLTNRAVEAADARPLVRRRWLLYPARALGAAIFLNVVGLTVAQALDGYGARDGHERPELYGIWDVTRFERDGAEVPPLATDATRWKHFVHDLPSFGGAQYVTVVAMNGERGTFVLAAKPPEENAASDAPRVYELKRVGGPTAAEAGGESEFVLERPSPGELVLDGLLDGAPVRVEMTRRLPEDFLLVNRGFHWVNELPFNR